MSCAAILYRKNKIFVVSFLKEDYKKILNFKKFLYIKNTRGNLAVYFDIKIKFLHQLLTEKINFKNTSKNVSNLYATTTKVLNYMYIIVRGNFAG